MARTIQVMLILIAVLHADAAVPGTPEPPHPGPPPRLWAEVGNDDLTLEGAEGASPDDHRTNEVSLGGTIGDAVLVADHSMLTDRADSRRSDELTLTLGWLPLVDPANSTGGWLAVGAGMRFSGDLDGDHVQSRWHRLFDLRVYQLTYDNRDEHPLAYATGAYHWWALANGGVEAGASALATTMGEVQTDIWSRAVFRTDSGCNALWAGLRWRGRSGIASGETARAVAAFERGLCADVGWQVGFLTVHALHDFGDRQSYGMVALEWRR